MSKYHLAFESPAYLLLLALIPLVWWFSYRRLAVLGPIRRLIAIGVRSLVITLIVFALAGAQMVRVSERLTVLYLLDQSLSIPAEQRQAMAALVNEAIVKHRQGDDRVGVIVFGRDAAIEIPPFDDNVQMSKTVESSLDPEHTNLAAALRLAQASFPEDAAKRVVIVSDGNENLGDVMQQAQSLTAAGVGIDVVPVRYEHRGEVVVERVMLPGNIRRGQPFDLKVVVSNVRQPGADDPGVVTGKLTIRKRLGDQSIVVSEDKVSLPPGKRVFTVRQEMDAAGFFTYDAAFVPDHKEDDAMAQNNRATAFTHIRGKGQVLLIEDSENRGEHERLLQALRRQNLEVVVRGSNQAFVDISDLQQYDTVVLGNVPRDHFTDDQIQMLVRNTQQLGSGLVMLGGPNSFGAGGWTNTPLEQAMPVDFQIKSTKVIPQGALAILMHASEIARGNYWQKVIAEEAIKALGPRDYCGLLHWDGSMMGGCSWLWNPGMCQVGGNRERMLAALGRMAPGDMPDFDPGLKLALQGFNRVPTAAVKHMIVISDGDPSDPSRAVVKALANLKVTVSTVAVGAHGPADSSRLRNLASATGGKYYQVNDPRQLPRIFQREARRVAQPLVFETQAGFRPFLLSSAHEVVSGLRDPLPPLNGFVLTSRKDSPLVEVSLLSPMPAGEKSNTILATWTYGLGKAVAFTSDVGARWATSWTRWEDYDKLFGQMIRWSMRPADDQDKFTVATDVQDGQVRVVVNALDKNDEFLNFLGMSGTVIGPDLKQRELRMEQTAPGRYQGVFPGRDSGSYFIAVSPGVGKAMVRTGITVPYSDEFRVRSTNLHLLEQLAALTPEEGEPGKVIDAPGNLDDPKPLAEIDSFRHDLVKATSSQDVWHYLALAACCLFFGDVFVRRVHVSFAWLPPLAGRVLDRLLRREPRVAPAPTIERLRSRKAEVSDQLDQLRASTRFEAPPEIVIDPQAIEQPTAAPSESKAPAPSLSPDQPAEDSYTARLLKAKKKVWEQQKRDEK